MAVRVNLTMPEKSKARLDALCKQVDSGTYTDVIANALRLYEWAVRETLAGNRVALKRKDGSFTDVELWIESSATTDDGLSSEARGQ